MATRARIEDGRLHEYEDAIALASRIMREARALGLDLDTDTLAYVHRRLTIIIEAAAELKRREIERMNMEKAAAKAGRGQCDE